MGCYNIEHLDERGYYVSSSYIEGSLKDALDFANNIAIQLSYNGACGHSLVVYDKYNRALAELRVN